MALKRSRSLTFSILVLGMLFILIAILLVSNTVMAEGEFEGGTDGNITIYADQREGEYEWNTLHNFVIFESHEKIDGPFNVTVCENIHYNESNNSYHASDHIFGLLTNIRWDDESPPSLTISEDDFKQFRSDRFTLTVFILGEYERQRSNGTNSTNGSRNEGNDGEIEVRQAYRKVTIHRWNEPPEAVARITDSNMDGSGKWNNWTTVTSSQQGEITYYLAEGSDNLTLYLNASDSWDPDGDPVTHIWWNFGNFGDGCIQHGNEMNTSLMLREGDHDLTLVVGDGKLISEYLDIYILIRRPIRRPDLSSQDIQAVNKNGQDTIEQGDRVGILVLVKNIGDKATASSFDVLVEYWYRDETPNQPLWKELDIDRVTDTIDVNGLKLVEVVWDTWSEDFKPGDYSFRATADLHEEVRELREGNNAFPAPDMENESEIVILDWGHPCHSDIRIVETTLSDYSPGISEIIFLDITLENTGDGDARYVDIYYYIDNAFQYLQTIDNLDTQYPVKVTFEFSEDVSTIYRVKFEVRDDGSIVETSDTININVGNTPTKNSPRVTIVSVSALHGRDDVYNISGTSWDYDHVEFVEYKPPGGDNWIRVNGTVNWYVHVNVDQVPGDEDIFLFRAYARGSFSPIQEVPIRSDEKDDGIPGFPVIFPMIALLIVACFRRRTSA